MRKCEVLVIDDQIGIARGITNRLIHGGLSARSSTSPSEGLRLFDLLNPGLVIVDSEMPGMSGAQVIERMGDIRRLPPVILMCSGGDAAGGREAASCAVIAKPFRFEEMHRLIRGALGAGGDGASGKAHS